jgi:hypothetical protein
MARGATCESSYQPYLLPHCGGKRKGLLTPPSFYSLHDYLRIATRSSPSTSSVPSLASSTCSSLRSSPAPSGLYQAAFVARAPTHPRIHRVPREFSVLGPASRSVVKTCPFFQQSTDSHPAALAGRLTSPFAWAAPAWGMSPCLALKCLRITSGQHTQYPDALISVSYIDTRLLLLC